MNTVFERRPRDLHHREFASQKSRIRSNEHASQMEPRRVEPRRVKASRSSNTKREAAEKLFSRTTHAHTHSQCMSLCVAVIVFM